MKKLRLNQLLLFNLTSSYFASKIETLGLNITYKMILYKRNITNYAIDLLKNFPALAIIGARQAGKTQLGQTIAPDFLYMDLEKGSDYDRVTADPEFFFKQNPGQVIFDEAQTCPDLFATLRGVIDEHRKTNNRFIITGSSSQELLKNVSESLAGRMALIELGTLKANEYYGTPLSPFYDLFKNKLEKNSVKLMEPSLTINQIQDFWFKGGYPQPISEGDAFFQEWMTAYKATYINRDISILFPKLDKVAYRRFLTILAKLSSQLINKSDIARSIGVSEPTIRDYLDIAAGTFLWRQLSSFENSATKSIVKMPRGHIRDSGLLHHLLRIKSIEDLLSDPIAGFSFEAFVIEEILKGLQDARIRDVDAYYYRTRNGAEIDLILQGGFGLLPIEIKYGSTVLRRQLKSLQDFIQAQNTPFGIIINQSDEMHWLTENILQVPAGCL